MLTLITCFTIQPASHAIYCRGKARYSWIIFQKISPYKLLGRPVTMLDECKSEEQVREARQTAMALLVTLGSGLNIYFIQRYFMDTESSWFLG